ncbi:MAG: DUF4382 domain-containing protein [Gammaproteobacteria bacterium]|nr:DUF4382 domain-containing protein [Gammaproteobacteria bacterium]
MPMSIIHPGRVFAALGCAVVLAACGGGGGSSSPDPTEAESGPATGSLSGGITDAAVDEVSAVNLRVTAVEFREEGAGEDDFVTIDLTDEDGNALEFNLLEFQNGEVFTLFEDVEVPAGVYEHTRLVLESPAQTPMQCNGQDPEEGSHVEVISGGLVPIFIPSGANTGVKLASPFRVPANGSAEIIIDFDLRQSLHRPPPFDCYFLRPAFRVEASETTGRIAGTVDSLLLDGSNELCSDDDPATGNAVYVYEGADRLPGDLNGTEDDAADPFATAAVEFDPSAGNTGEGEFLAAFLPPGDYTVAFTCKADLERLPDPDSDVEDERQAVDELDFQQPQTVTVEVQETSVVEFELVEE